MLSGNPRVWAYIWPLCWAVWAHKTSFEWTHHRCLPLTTTDRTANDPFEETHEDETASVALARITEKLSKLEEKMDRIEQKVDHQSGAEAKQGGEVVTELDEI